MAILEKHDNLSKEKEIRIASLYFHERVTADNNGKRGIDPIRALTSHSRNLALLVNKSLHSLPTPSTCSRSQQRRVITLKDGSSKLAPDFITVTRGPGMRSNLSCGLNTAKGLAVAWQIPLLAVHHMQAHALTPRLVHALESQSASSIIQPQFPFLSLLVSGGHTLLLQSKSLTSHKTIATTHDIAIGEALDKIGRLLLPLSIQATLPDISYAKHLSTYAFPTPASYADYLPPPNRGAECTRSLAPFGWHLPTPLSDTRQLRFSFSGLASEVHRLFAMRTTTTTDLPFTETERLALARSALTISFHHLASRTVIALEALRRDQQPITTLVVSGGVAANTYLRHVLRQFLDVRGFAEVKLRFPPVDLCTDNAAMIAWCGMEMFEEGWRSELGCRVVRRWSMDSEEGTERNSKREAETVRV